MNKNISNFIKTHKNLINNNEWEKIYKDANDDSEFYMHVGKLTQILLESSIDPLDYIDYIPERYLRYTDVKEFQLPNNIIRIDNYAFFNCLKLTNIIISNSVISIGEAAFYACISLENVIIGSGVKTIEAGAFSHCYKLSKITYNGTKSQWDTIKKGEDWEAFSRVKTIQCIDGDLKIRN